MLIVNAFVHIMRENSKIMAIIGDRTLHTYMHTYIHTGRIPPDGSPEMITHTFHVSLVALYYTLAALGITLAIACLVFNFTFRKKK